jgi:predicted RNA binding protein YcfA (HicA-like mRNA interferase family)
MNGRRLPSLRAREVIRALQNAGFSIVRTSGSHYRLVHDTDPTRQTTVPMHKGKDIPRGTLRAIIEQAGLTVEEFIDLL